MQIKCGRILYKLVLWSYTYYLFMDPMVGESAGEEDRLVWTLWRRGKVARAWPRLHA